MTRPPDYDLGTVEGIMATSKAWELAHARAVAWSRGLSSVAPEYAYKAATEAAHHARRLQGVAALVSVSGDLAAWQAWRERGKA